MTYDKETRRSIYRRTDGRCHLCHGKVILKNHGRPQERGAWHVDHSRPRARGGSDHGNNLYPAHIDCNLKKGVRASRSARAAHGKRRVPCSFERKRSVRAGNTATGAFGGAVAGGAIGGPPGAIIGALIGGLFGSELKVV
jgi:5-methylcytosine-specific restriction endonuclease McrA